MRLDIDRFEQDWLNIWIRKLNNIELRVSKGGG